MEELYKAQNYNENSAKNISDELVKIFSRRRTIRTFSEEIPPIETVLNAIDIAHLAPSGANQQPWSFCLVHSAKVKSEIRSLAEKEEHRFYHTNPNQKWLDSIKHLNTGPEKAFLEEAPYLIIVFTKSYQKEGDTNQVNYYAKESVGIATGMLISALHLTGLSTLTYTPARMQFLTSYFNRPVEEKPFMVLATGLPKEGTKVPTITKKSLDDILDIYF